METLLANKELAAAAKRIVALGFGTPVLFFLEMHKPFSSVFNTAAIVLQPLLMPFIGISRYHFILNLLSHREHLEEFLQYIESDLAKIPVSDGAH